MYNEFFGFQEAPFSATPNTQFFYTNELYQETLANLCYGIECSKGLIVVTGEVGTGKTTLLYKTMRSLKATTRPLFLSYHHLTYAELLRHISTELGLATDAPDQLATATRLREHLIAQQKKGHTVALLIDEAQSLSDEMFEGVRFLSNFETEQDKLFQIVLSGQPELATRLDQPALRHLKQRIVFHCRLSPLKKDEVGRYIDFRLQKAGFESRHLFVADAVAQVASYSRGIPRLINIICDNGLLLAFALSKKQVSKEMIEEVARDLGLRDHSQIGTPAAPPGLKAEDEKEFSSKTELTAGERWNADSGGSRDLVEAESGPARRQKSGAGPMSIVISVTLIALAGAVGALSSQQTRDYIRNVVRQAPAAGDESGTNSPGETQIAVSSGERFAAKHTKPDEPALERSTPEVITPNVDNRQVQTESKKREAVSGLFEVVGPFSFVRRTPRADADIIATLQPATRLNVVNVRGDYFLVQALVNGRRIRGYVHREDAFFQRATNRSQRKTRIR